PQERSKRYVAHQINNVLVGLALGGVVVVHQEDAGDGENQEEVKGNAAHPPGKTVTHRVAVDLGRMEVKENVREYAEGAAAVRVIVLDPEHGLEKLRLCRLLEALNFFFGLPFQNLSLFLELFDKATQTLAFPAVAAFLVGHCGSLDSRFAFFAAKERALGLHGDI